MIIKNSKNIANVYKGDTSIAKIYKGNDLVYQKNIGPSNILKFEFSGDTMTFTANTKKITATTSPYSIDLNKELDGQPLTTLRFNSSTMTNFISIEDTSNITNMIQMFGSCTRLQTVNLQNFDTSNVTRMNAMFYSCKSLTTLDLSNFDTSNVTSMGDMFNGCNLLTSLNVSSFNTSKVTDMNTMFFGCNALNEITCKQAFKDWCITNQDKIKLPSAMRNGGSGKWIIVE